jgi:hypothetical protein
MQGAGQQRLILITQQPLPFLRRRQQPASASASCEASNAAAEGGAAGWPLTAWPQGRWRAGELLGLTGTAASAVPGGSCAASRSREAGAARRGLPTPAFVPAASANLLALKHLQRLRMCCTLFKYSYRNCLYINCSYRKAGKSGRESKTSNAVRAGTGQSLPSVCFMRFCTAPGPPIIISSSILQRRRWGRCSAGVGGSAGLRCPLYRRRGACVGRAGVCSELPHAPLLLREGSPAWGAPADLGPLPPSLASLRAGSPLALAARPLQPCGPLGSPWGRELQRSSAAG